MEKARKRSGIERVLGQSIGVDPEQCGLLLLAGPVGAGKTYSSMSPIADQLIAFGPKCRRFVFVTNVKRNLPVDELLQILDERGHPELAAYVVKLDSNLGMFQAPRSPIGKKDPRSPGRMSARSSRPNSTFGTFPSCKKRRGCSGFSRRRGTSLCMSVLLGARQSKALRRKRRRPRASFDDTFRRYLRPCASLMKTATA